MIIRRVSGSVGYPTNAFGRIVNERVPRERLVFFSPSEYARRTESEDDNIVW